MNKNPAHLYTLLQSTGAIVWEANLDMNQFSFIEYHDQEFLGYTLESWTETRDFWKSRIHVDDVLVADRYSDLLKSTEKTHIFEYRMIRSDNNIVWIKDNVCVLYDDHGKPFLTGIMMETTEFKRLSLLKQLEERISSMTMDINISLKSLFLTYLQGLEELFPEMHCSIFRIKNGHLQNGVAPSLPESYIASLENAKIGKEIGSCGAAAVQKKQIIVSDISTDPKWKDYYKLAISNGLWACWSNPIINSDGEVTATIAMYCRQPRPPSDEEIEMMERATILLRGILENREKTEIIREANLLMLQSQELAHFGNWNWDVTNNIVNWSPALFAIYGIDSSRFDATFEGYLDLLHTDDRDRVKFTIEQILRTGKDAEFEERIVRSNGEIRYLRSWAKLKKNQNGVPIAMIGACLDNTEMVKHVKNFEEIAWSQSHVIRAPLCRIMSLVELIRGSAVDEILANKLLEHLLNSADELDEQIRIISRRTELLGEQRKNSLNL